MILARGAARSFFTKFFAFLIFPLTFRAKSAIIIKSGGNVTTDFQLRTILKMVLEILRGCKDLPDAIQKLEELTREEGKSRP